MSVFTEKLRDPDKFSVLVEFTSPAGDPPKRIIDFLEKYEQRKPMWNGMEIVGLTVTQNPSGVVTASPTDVIAHILLNGGLRGLSYVPHVSVKGMNSSDIKTFLKGLQSYGVEDCFVVTGDEPAEGKRVFELDSLSLLRMIRKDNAEARLAAGPTGDVKTLSTGAALGLAKYEEGSCLQQMIKMEKKALAGGAEYMITNLIFDVKKVEDLFRYLRERNLNIPIVGNVFLLKPGGARRMLDEKLPGVYVSHELAERVSKETPDERIMRAARQVAMWRDLGAAGVDLGMVEDYDVACKILDLSVEIGSNWREAYDSLHFPPPMEKPFYLYDEQGQRTPLRDPQVPARRLFLNWVHNMMFEPDTVGYKMVKKIFESSKSIREGEGLLYDTTELVEYIGKRIAAKCEACGDCHLPENFFVCVKGECTKGLPNVPCGDSTIDGRCGVDDSRKCAGQLVYDAARHFTKELDSLRKLVNDPHMVELDKTASLPNYFLGKDHARKKPLIQVAELLHSSLPKCKEAFDIIRETENGWTTPNPGLNYLKAVVEAQAFHTPAYIDANCDDAGEGDTELTSEMMRNLVRLIVENSGGIPPCIDSSDEAVLKAGLQEYYRLASEGAPIPLLNSAAEERKAFIWEFQKIGPCNIVYMLTEGAAAGEEGAEGATPESLEQKALKFFHEAKSHGMRPEQIFFDTTVIPFVVEFSRFGKPGFNYINLKAIQRITSNPEMKGVNTILGITNVVRQFPPGRKIGVVRAFIQIAMEHGLTAGIVDVMNEFGVVPPSDQQIVGIVRAFCEYDGSEESMNRMQEAYALYRSFAPKKKPQPATAA